LVEVGWRSVALVGNPQYPAGDYVA
jgi:hypothetical protein